MRAVAYSLPTFSNVASSGNTVRSCAITMGQWVTAVLPQRTTTRTQTHGFDVVTGVTVAPLEVHEAVGAL